MLISNHFICARNSFSLDACRPKRVVGADPHASQMCSKSLSLDARRSNCASEMLISEFIVHSYLLSFDARRSKCLSYFLRCALARHLSIQMRVLWVRVRSRSTLVYPNALPVWSDALLSDTCRSKCVFYFARCALARRLSIQMRFLYGQACSRLTLVGPIPLPTLLSVPSLDASRSI